MNYWWNIVVSTSITYIIRSSSTTSIFSKKSSEIQLYKHTIFILMVHKPSIIFLSRSTPSRVRWYGLTRLPIRNKWSQKSTKRLAVGGRGFNCKFTKSVDEPQNNTVNSHYLMPPHFHLLGNDVTYVAPRFAHLISTSTIAIYCDTCSHLLGLRLNLFHLRRHFSTSN